jgi:Ni/Fe-hydrogenase subunit HybB-like protein
MFLGYAISSVGGMLYRFSPTTLAYMPGPDAMYFPSVIELLIALGFAATGIAVFLVMVKLFAILPAPVQEWRNMASYFKARKPYISWTKYFNFGFFGDTEPTEFD